MSVPRFVLQFQVSNIFRGVLQGTGNPLRIIGKAAEGGRRQYALAFNNACESFNIIDLSATILSVAEGGGTQAQGRVDLTGKSFVLCGVWTTDNMMIYNNNSIDVDNATPSKVNVPNLDVLIGCRRVK